MGSLKKVVLIAAANDFAGNVNVANLTSLLAPPLGILALGSYLAAHDVPVELIDVQMDFGFGLTHAGEGEVSRRLVRYLLDRADTIAWIGVSQLSNSGSGVALAEEIHRALPGIPLVLGGYFPSSAYRVLLEKSPFITAIVRGDGEAAALAICQYLAEGRSFLTEEIPNLAWRDNGQICTSAAQPIALDGLPILDVRLLRNRHGYQVIDLMTSRGCPFRCNYCLEGSMRPYATYPPSWVDRQLAHLEAEAPNERIFIYDPVFGLGRDRVLDMSRVLGNHRFGYGVESRVDVLAAELVPVLRRSGVETIFWGVESASPGTLMRMQKVQSESEAEGYLHSALVAQVACFENGVTPVMGLMLGFPGDCEADYQATLAFAKEIRHLHDTVAAQTGVATGFVPFAFYTKVYAGSCLADWVHAEYPDAILRSEPFIGEMTVLSPSPGLDLNATQRYQVEIARQGVYSRLAQERLSRYYSFSMNAFLAAHPELTDEQDVTVLGDSLRRFPPRFTFESMQMHFDKSKG